MQATQLSKGSVAGRSAKRVAITRPVQRRLLKVQVKAASSVPPPNGHVNGYANGYANGNGNGNGNGIGSRFPFHIPGLTSTPSQLPSKPVDGVFKASGKTVVITGGSQGVGRATALLFAKKGYNVVVAARDATRLQYVANDCATLAGRQGASLGIICDVTDERQVKDMVNTVMAKYENVDVLVNCAGIMVRGAFKEVPAMEARHMMETNYLGPYLVTQAFMPILMKEGQKRSGFDKPSVIMVNSFASKVPMKYMSAFTASKYALAGFTEAIRSELGPLNIHVGQVHPGAVKSNHMERTKFYGKDSEEDRKTFRQVVRAMPISQTPQEVADAIYNAAQNKQDEVVVGMSFAAAAQAFRMTGFNPATLPFV